METLSGDLFEEILRYLELGDQIKLRRVSKKWMKTIDSMEKRLTISSASKQSGFKYGLNLVRDHIRTPTIQTVLGLLKQPQLSNLKSLCIYKLDVGKESGLFCKAISLDQLNDLTISCIENLAEEIELRLPNLTKIFVGYLKTKKVTLNAPKLKDVKIRFGKANEFDLKFVHPSVQCIELEKFSKSLESAELKKSLKRLYCVEIEQVADDFLKEFKQLEEIHFSRKLEIFSVLFKQKKEYVRVDLKIYFKGLRVDSLEEFEEWFGNESNESDKSIEFYGHRLPVEELIDLYIANYPRLASRLPFCDSLNYQRIEDRLHQLPSDFFGRLVNLEMITTCKQVKNVKNYLNFLRANFRDLSSLGVLIDFQPQIFYNLLPQCCPSIRSMMITGCDPAFFTGVEILDINLNFVFELKDLVTFSCTVDLSDAFIRKIYQHLKYIEYLGFKYNGSLKAVTTKAPNEFQFAGSQTKFTNVNDLIAHLKTSQFNLSGLMAAMRSNLNQIEKKRSSRTIRRK